MRYTITFKIKCFKVNKGLKFIKCKIIKFIKFKLHKCPLQIT